MMMPMGPLLRASATANCGGDSEVAPAVQVYPGRQRPSDPEPARPWLSDSESASQPRLPQWPIATIVTVPVTVDGHWQERPWARPPGRRSLSHRRKPRAPDAAPQRPRLIKHAPATGSIGVSKRLSKTGQARQRRTLRLPEVATQPVPLSGTPRAGSAIVPVPPWPGSSRDERRTLSSKAVKPQPPVFSQMVFRVPLLSSSKDSSSIRDSSALLLEYQPQLLVFSSKMTDFQGCLV